MQQWESFVHLDSLYIFFFSFLTGFVAAVVFKIGTIIQGQQELWGLFAALKWNAIQMASREQIVFSKARN